MSKYAPLNEFLRSCEAPRVSLDFVRVEQIIGAPLPKSAFSHAAWWANNTEGHSHSRAWIEAGWHTENLSFEKMRIDFIRKRLRDTSSAKAAKPTLWGALAGTVKIIDGSDITHPTGEIWDAEGGIL